MHLNGANIASDTDPLQRYRPILPGILQPPHSALGRPHSRRTRKTRGAICRREGGLRGPCGCHRRVHGRCRQGIQPFGIRQPFRERSARRLHRKCRGKPATIQELARFLVAEPNHWALPRCSAAFRNSPPRTAIFADVKIDCRKGILGGDPPWRFRYRRQWARGDYPSPDLFASEASGESHQHDP